MPQILSAQRKYVPVTIKISYTNLYKKCSETLWKQMLEAAADILLTMV